MTYEVSMIEADVVCQSCDNDKLLWFYVFQYCLFFIQRVQVCDIKIGGPKKIAEEFVRPRKIAEISSNPKKIAQKFANPEK